MESDKNNRRKKHIIYKDGELIMNDENKKNTNPEDILKQASETIGTSTEELKKAAKTGNIKDILNKLDKNQTQKLTSMLSDKALTSKILSSPQAKQLLKKFFGR